MLKTTRIAVVVALGMSMSALASTKHAEPVMKEEKPGLMAQAKVTADAARKTALSKAPGKIQSEEVEQHDGKLVYSFDIKAAHKSGVQEVQVDAMTGQVVSVKHEGAKVEAKEKKSETVTPAAPK